MTRRHVQPKRDHGERTTRRRRGAVGALAVVLVGTGLVLAGPARADHGSSQARGVDLACPPGEVDSAGFADIADQGEEQQAAIDCIAAHDVTKGVSATVYDPSGTVTRGQMASFVMRTLDRVLGYERPADAPDAFGDDDGFTHEVNIDDAAAEGIVLGRADGTFGPGERVTRAQMASFVARTLEVAGVDVPAAAPDAFGDDDASTHEANIDALAHLHIVQGTGPGSYSPEAPVTRVQMALFLGRTLDLLVDDGRAAPADTVAPTFDEVTAARATTTATALFSEPLDCNTVEAADFTATVNGSPSTLSGASCSGAAASAVELTLASALAVGDKVAVTLDGPVADPAGNEAAHPETRQVVVPDGDPPTLAITSGPDEGTFTPEARPTWEGSAEAPGGPDVALVEARVDAASFAKAACTGCPGDAVTWSFTPPEDLTDGAHTVELRAKDDDGTRSATASRTFTVDTVAPELTSITAAAGDADVAAVFTDADGVDCSTVQVGGATPSFTATVAGADAEVTEVDCVSPSSTDLTLTLATAPLGGDTVVVAVADGGVADRAGNGAMAADSSDTVANEIPEVTVDTEPDNPTNDPTPTYEGTAADSDGIVDRVEAKVGSGDFAPVDCTRCGTSSATWTFTPALDDGHHTITFRSVDNADLASAPASRSFTVDRTAPVFESIIATALSPMVSAVFDAGDTDIDCDGGDVAAEFEVAFDFTDVPVLSAACNGNVVELTLALAPQPGTTVQVQASANIQDLAGNATGVARQEVEDV